MKPSFILALFQHGYKVRTSTLYHLLKGKRTSSVLLYGFFYNNLPFFQLFPELSETQYNKIINELAEKHLLRLNSNGDAQITAKGQQVIASNQQYMWLDNYRLGRTDEAIWRLLQFTVQVVSQLSYSNKHYIPLEQSPLYQNQVKMYIKSMPKAKLIERIKQEWQEIFSALSTEEANFFARQFSGYKQIGKTSFQLLDMENKAFDRFLIKKDRIHHLLKVIQKLPNNSFLKELIRPLLKQNENNSMNETRKYLNKHFSLDELALQRGVKRSTVQDHLLEVALTNDFPFERFISNETVNFLDNFKPPYQEWDYRSLKQTKPEFDYFEFRLYQIQKMKEERDKSR
ncbi:helix-turn-helix domain-containing protein [Candidatus Enterococcus mansonii]|uniref:Helicase Helix-turn-helix domain-containing protein n=1 Tax=Candidatus Enterococcus mansonii TaxID=1834181 RepID=A0A242CKS2_9ENTE|nr:helix-turn-helix domain-containing protein [Enterococcus sp. 4G2_DIV0659]OTO10520.1 hypothetical protein A5880_001204 [Enterococcus sp. 4G2_DIV0659]